LRGEVSKAQKNPIGMYYRNRNYTAIHGRNHVSAKIRNSDNNIGKQGYNTKVRVLQQLAWIYIHTLMNWIYKVVQI
jgi:hypothetical protein